MESTNWLGLYRAEHGFKAELRLMSMYRRGYSHRDMAVALSDLPCPYGGQWDEGKVLRFRWALHRADRGFALIEA